MIFASKSLALITCCALTLDARNFKSSVNSLKKHISINDLRLWTLKITLELLKQYPKAETISLEAIVHCSLFFCQFYSMNIFGLVRLPYLWCHYKIISGFPLHFSVFVLHKDCTRKWYTGQIFRKPKVNSGNRFVFMRLKFKGNFSLIFF